MKPILLGAQKYHLLINVVRLQLAVTMVGQTKELSIMSINICRNFCGKMVMDIAIKFLQ